MITNPLNSTSGDIHRRHPRIVVGGVDTRLTAFHAAGKCTTSTEKTTASQPSEAILRTQIREIYQDGSLDEQTKARQVQHLLSPPTPSSVAADADTFLEKTFHDFERGILGCSHYKRKAKVKSVCCNKIYTCHLCHDEVSDHWMDRHTTISMLCMLCQTLQPAAKSCRTCHVDLGKYYCGICHLWNDNPEQTFHCGPCGICRHGRQDDYFHCTKCNICMTISMKNNHKCIEHSLESDCPICGVYMFTSRITVGFLPCGHSLHKTCYSDYSKRAYQCPVCLKSMTNMKGYFRWMNHELGTQTMPAEYDGMTASLFCNDCEKRSDAKYHFFYHKCCHCDSYNTTVLNTRLENASTV